MLITIHGTQLRKAESPGVEEYNLTKSGRVASGKMTMEIVATKKKITCTWPVLTSAEVKAIRDVVFVKNRPFFTIEYEDDTEEGGKGSFTCYAGALKRSFLRSGPVTYWKDVSIDFIEQ